MPYYPKEPKSMRTIKDVCSMYGVQPLERGFIVTAGGLVENVDASESNRYMVWTPTAQNDNWENRLIENGNVIVECNKDMPANDEHVGNLSNEAGLRRITFWRETARDEFRFIGVFVVDVELSIATNASIYRKISDILPAIKIQLKP